MILYYSLRIILKISYASLTCKIRFFFIDKHDNKKLYNIKDELVCILKKRGLKYSAL